MLGNPKTLENMNLSLDGEWNIIFDASNEGREAGWMNSRVFEAHSKCQRISVPCCWEEIQEDYEGVAFYQKKFELSEDWKEKVVYLKFDAVNYLAEVYLNDEVLGFHEGGFTPFQFNIEHLLDYEKENVLTLRVVGPVTMTDQVIDGMGPMQTPQWRGAYTGGIWQSVCLEATDKIHHKDLFIETHLSDDSVDLHYEIHNTHRSKQKIDLEVAIFSKVEGEKKVTLRETMELNPGINKSSLRIDLEDATYWCPENPFLYQVDSRILREGTLLECKLENFGMREFTIRNEQLQLNGKPLFLKATFFEALYPVKLANPDSREMAIREIQLAKECGFNMIRPWRKPPSKMWLDLADEMGVLVVGSLVVECMGKPNASPYLPRRVETELRESILRDRNRACVVQWELFNELHRPILMNMLHPMSIKARELDPTRLILDESGGWAYGANLYLPYEYEPTPFNDIHHYPGPNINQNKFDAFLVIGKTEEEKEAMGKVIKTPGKNVVPGRMSFVSELGYGSLGDLAANNLEFEKKGNPITPPYKYHKKLHAQTEVVFQKAGYEAIFENLSAFYLEQQKVHGAANRRMMEAARCNPTVNGYCIHALTAGNWIIGAGILDLWRNPKQEAFEGTKAANQPRQTVLRILPRNIYAGEDAELEIIGINEFEEISGTLELKVSNPQGEVLKSNRLQSNLINGSELFYSEVFETHNFEGNYQVEILLKDDSGTMLSESKESFMVIKNEDLQPSIDSVAVVDPGGQLKSFFEGKNVAVSNFGVETSLDTLVVVGHIKDWNGVGDFEFTKSLNAFVKKGGKAIYLQVPGKERVPMGPKSYDKKEGFKGEDWLPTKPTLRGATGLWDGILHMAHDHPVFEGLPVHQSMVEVYENLSPWHSMHAEEGDKMITSIAFDRFPNLDDAKKNYVGPGDAWWGTDMVAQNYGAGKMILTTLYIVENLGKDPVADKLLCNLIKYID